MTPRHPAGSATAAGPAKRPGADQAATALERLRAIGLGSAAGPKAALAGPARRDLAKRVKARPGSAPRT